MLKGNDGIRMKICLYTNTAFPCVGGQEMVVDELARQYQRLGHSVVMLCPEPPRHLKAQDHDFPYRIERHPRFVSTRWFVSWYELSLKRLYHEFPYDIIHCHNVYPNGYLAVKHKMRGGPPVVVTSHGGDVRSDNPRFRKPGLRSRHQFAVQQADALVSIGPFTKQGFLDLGAPAHLIQSIANGVHAHGLAEFVRRPETIPSQIQDKKYILFVGRLAQRKGVDTLVQAVAHLQVSRMLDQHPTQLVICGDGAEREPLKLLVSQLGLSEHVTFMGNVRGATKHWLLQNASTLVIPSRHWEAYPMVLLEGFASGCSVIASDAPGLLGLVDHEKNGLVFPRDNAKALAEALTQILEKPELAAKIAKGGQQIAHRCDWKRIAQQHIDLFNQLLGNQHQYHLRIAA